MAYPFPSQLAHEGALISVLKYRGFPLWILKDGLPQRVSGVRICSTVESFEEIPYLFETSGIDINPDIVGKVSILFKDERVIFNSFLKEFF